MKAIFIGLVLAAAVGGATWAEDVRSEEGLRGVKTVVLASVTAPRFFTTVRFPKYRRGGSKEERIGQDLAEFVYQEIQQSLAAKGWKIITGDRVISEFEKQNPMMFEENVFKELTSRGMSQRDALRGLCQVYNRPVVPPEENENPSPRSDVPELRSQGADLVLARGTVDLLAPYYGLPEDKKIHVWTASTSDAVDRGAKLIASLGADATFTADVDCYRPASSRSAGLGSAFAQDSAPPSIRASCSLSFTLRNKDGATLWGGSYEGDVPGNAPPVAGANEREKNLVLAKDAIKEALKKAFPPS